MRRSPVKGPHRALAGVLLAVGLVFTGCSSSPGSELAAQSDANAGGGSVAAPDESAGRSRADADGGSAAKPGADKSGSGSTVAKGEIRDRSIIRVGRMRIRVTDVRAATGKASALVGGTDGYVESEQSVADDDGKTTSSQVVLRVEVDDFQRVAGELRKFGKVLADQSDTTDVTEEIVDVESRIESQEDSIARMRALLGSAKTVGEVIQVESELSVRQAELESLQGRYAVLSSQTSLSTITVDFERKEKPEDKPEKEDESGFLWGLGQGWDALLGAGSALLTVVGVVLPFAVIITIIGVPSWVLLRNRLRRRPTSPPEPAPTPTS